MNRKMNIIFAIVLVMILVLLIVGTGIFKRKSNDDLSPNTTNTGVNNGIENTTIIEKNFNQEELFTERDLKQEVDLTSATKYEVTDSADIQIDKEGVYVISGTAENVTIYVEAGDDEKVQLVLDNLNITNKDKECIHVENADKVFITTSAQSSLSYSVTDTENATGAIFSRDDITLNGNGTLIIYSENNGIIGKDDIKITGGTYHITAAKNGIRANDSIRVAGGTFDLKSGTDGLHAENSDDDAKGYIYISGGIFEIEAGDDAIHAVSVVQIDGGAINITAGEGIEGTYVQINDGTITIQASDDGINAAKKSTAYTPTIVINGGNIKIEMGKGDTDCIDSNGDIIINGGTIDVTGSATFDYDGKAEHNGGTIVINGEEIETIPNQWMGGMSGGRGGQRLQTNLDGKMPSDFEENLEGKMPPDFSGEFKGKRVPADFSGDFNDRKTPSALNGDFDKEKAVKDFQKKRAKQGEVI